MFGHPTHHLITVAPIIDSFGAVLADCLEHPIAVASAADEAVRSQSRQHFEIHVTHVFGCLECAPAAKYRKPGEQPLFAGDRSS